MGAHIGVDAFVKTLSREHARVLNLVAAGLRLLCAGIVVVGGWIYVRKMYEVGILMQDLPIDQRNPRATLPLGFALLGLRFTQLRWRVARMRTCWVTRPRMR